ncbi:MAG TPA: hypothetical protein VOA64_14535, partial [Candidatus Dormibacteraeota bacterium]|nr:hypothetical protein [Candidatus Dormibacteraeota bacterium]
RNGYTTAENKKKYNPKCFLVTCAHARAASVSSIITTTHNISPPAEERAARVLWRGKNVFAMKDHQQIQVISTSTPMRQN